MTDCEKCDDNDNIITRFKYQIEMGTFAKFLKISKILILNIKKHYLVIINIIDYHLGRLRYSTAPPLSSSLNFEPNHFEGDED